MKPRNKGFWTQREKALLYCLMPLVTFIFLMFCYPVSAYAQNPDPNTCDIITPTGQEISLELLLYDTTSPFYPDEPESPQTIIGFRECTALDPSDPNLPTPFGEFPYGLWRTKISLTQQFDPNTHRIFMKLYFPGPIDPLNAQYWAQEYNVNEEKNEWKEFEQSEGLLLPDVSHKSVTIRLSDARPSGTPGDTLPGLGDQDPNDGMIDHLGGLLWPIPYGGRCFIDY